MVKVPEDGFVVSESMLLFLKFFVIEILSQNLYWLLFACFWRRLDLNLSKWTDWLLQLVLNHWDFLPIFTYLVNWLRDILVPLLNLIDHPLTLLYVKNLVIDGLFLILQIPSWEPVQVRSGPLLGRDILNSVEIPLHNFHVFLFDTFESRLLYLWGYFLDHGQFELLSGLFVEVCRGLWVADTIKLIVLLKW